MAGFDSKTRTDPGPFKDPSQRDAGPAPQRNDPTLRERAARREAPDTEPASDGGHRVEEEFFAAGDAPAAEAAGDLDLFRFQEIPVSSEMRRELLGAKLPLASAEQLLDTQPPGGSGERSQPESVRRQQRARSESAAGERTERPEAGEDARAADEWSPGNPDAGAPTEGADEAQYYSNTAPTLLNLRRRRARSRRVVVGVMAASGVLVAVWLFLRVSGEVTDSGGARVVESPEVRRAGPTRHISGNRSRAEQEAGRPLRLPPPSPAALGASALPAGPESVAGRNGTAGAIVTQPGEQSPDSVHAAARQTATSGPGRPEPAAARGASVQAPTSGAAASSLQPPEPSTRNDAASGPGRGKPAEKNSFDPEELIF